MSNTTKFLRIPVAMGDAEAADQAIRLLMRVFLERGFEEELVIEGTSVLVDIIRRRKYDPAFSIRGLFFGILRKLKLKASSRIARELPVSEIQAPDQDLFEEIESPYPSPEEAFFASLDEELGTQVDSASLMRELVETQVPHRHRRLAELRFIEKRPPAEIVGILQNDADFMSSFKTLWPRSELTHDWVRATLQNIRRNHLAAWFGCEEDAINVPPRRIISRQVE